VNTTYITAKRYTYGPGTVRIEYYESPEGITGALRVKKFDAKGNIIREEFTDTADPERSFTCDYNYIFDKQGNWTTCIESRKDAAPIKTVRVLHYANGKPIHNPVPAMDPCAMPALNKMLAEEKFYEAATLDGEIYHLKP
jgi:hypothetical protein